MNKPIRFKKLSILMTTLLIPICSQSIFQIHSINQSEPINLISQTVDPQSIHINQNQINLITSDPIIQSNPIQNCQTHYLFSITPSKVDSSLIYQVSPTSPTTNQLEWWKDDLNNYLSQVQQIEKSFNQSNLTNQSDLTNQLIFNANENQNQNQNQNQNPNRNPNPNRNHCNNLNTHLAFQTNFTALVFVPFKSLKLFTERLPIHMELLIHLNQTLSLRKNQINQSENLKNSNEKLSHELLKINYQPKIDQLINSLNLKDFINHSKKIIGNSLKSKWITRNTFSNEILLAFDWLENQFKQFGISCEFHFYQIGFAPNLICKILSTLNDTNEKGLNRDRIVLSSHLDSRGDFGILSAPGADNNAFGCSILLSIAKSIKLEKLSLKKDIYFIIFSGTEQGSWGSQYLSNKWKDENFEILLLLNLNMIGYRVPGESLQLGLPKKNQFNLILNWYIGNITNLYLPELFVGQTPVRDLDSQNFGLNNGIPSTSLFERVGPIGNPFYHTSFDLIEKVGYDLVQALTIGKAMYATVLQLAL